VRILLVMLAAAAVVLPASAASVDPQALVIAGSDVPAGFRFDPKESGLRSNALEAKEYPPARQLFVRWRRVTGYQAMYRRGSAKVESRADVFRAADGARKMLAWVDLEARKAGLLKQKRARVEVGVEGWIHWVPGGYTLVVWRHGRVFAGLMGYGITRDRTLALARMQQQRIAAAL
jgi:hypothetical protein